MKVAQKGLIKYGIYRLENDNNDVCVVLNTDDTPLILILPTELESNEMVNEYIEKELRKKVINTSFAILHKDAGYMGKVNKRYYSELDEIGNCMF